eukprot:NODE_1591_length_1447_cov_28.392424_g1509_i0.p1 GENE.NODE_1591_length_1447_cov_28.392424_g1509_i0~~NODE_1591_length_1447_cov_28.392424_g1509_i0.p1  ORF type:complete len:457 (+),score=73.94 NODE_1591_length_1447_cov_28.392424_g1509_i0:70-1440(+)
MWGVAPVCLWGYLVAWVLLVLKIRESIIATRCRSFTSALRLLPYLMLYITVVGSLASLALWVIVRPLRDPSTVPTVDCSQGWTFHAGLCYRYNPSPHPSRHRAHLHCVAAGGRLASAATVSHNEFLKELVVAGGYPFPPSSSYRHLANVGVWHHNAHPSHAHHHGVVCQKYLHVVEDPGLAFYTNCLPRLVAFMLMVLLLHPHVEHFVCHQQVLWLQNGNGKVYGPHWSVLRNHSLAPSGALLALLWAYPTFTVSPRMYICKRLACLVVLITGALGVGSCVRAMGPSLHPFLPPFRLTLTEAQAAGVVLGAVLDWSLAASGCGGFLKLEALRMRVTIVSRPPSEQSEVSEVSDSPCCRICHDEGPPFLTPCQCVGSMQHVHLHCLQRWRSYNPLPHCGVCGCPFLFQPNPWAPTTALRYISRICQAAQQLQRSLGSYARLLGVPCRTPLASPRSLD